MNSRASESSAEVLNDPILSQVPVRGGFKTLGPCALMDRLGRGGMGAVYSAWHMNLGLTVAVKCLTISSEDRQAVKRFRREARAAAQVKNDNVVGVFDVSESDGVHYIIMEFVEGQDLRARVKERGPYSPEEAVKIMKAACRGLAVAHSKEVIHRDIKPANIMIAADGTVKIADLGLARAARIADSLEATRGMMGTPIYMPPEQFEDAGGVDSSADVWALGAVFYYLVTGKNGNPATNVIQAQLEAMKGMPPLPERRRDPWRQLNAVIQRCTNPDPHQRYPDAGQLLRALETVQLGGNEEATKPLSRRPRSKPKSWPRPKKRDWVIALSVLGSLFLVWAVLVLMRKNPELVPQGVMEVKDPGGQEKGFVAAGEPTLSLVFVPGMEDYNLQGRPVQIRDFYIGKFEVTNAQYERFLKATDRSDDRVPMKGDPEYHSRFNYPVAGLSAEDAEAYCRWLGGDLPTEAQWECAGLGGNPTEESVPFFPWGEGWPDALPDVPLNYSGFRLSSDKEVRDIRDGFEGPAPVGSFPQGKSYWKTLDQAGNVREWCRTNSSGRFIARGGGFEDPAFVCRTNYRPEPNLPPSPTGFRIAFPKLD